MPAPGPSLGRRRNDKWLLQLAIGLLVLGVLLRLAAGFERPLGVTADTTATDSIGRAVVPPPTTATQPADTAAVATDSAAAPPPVAADSALVPAPAPPAAPAPEPARGRHVVALGVFQLEANALAVRDSVAARGLAVTVVRAPTGRFRVLVPDIETAEEAERIALRLRQELALDPIIQERPR